MKSKTFSNMNSAKKNSKRIARLGICLTLLLPLCGIAQDGQAIFRDNCGACHTVGKGRLVGPDLAGATTKHQEAWLLKWVKSSTSLIASGDADAKTLFDQFKIPMPDFKLSEPEMKAVFAFIASNSPGAKSEKAKVVAPPIVAQSSGPKSASLLFDHPLMYLYSILFIFILAVAYSVANAKRVLELNGKKFDLAPVSTYKKVSRVKGRCDIYASCSSFPNCANWSKKEVLSLCPKEN